MAIFAPIQFSLIFWLSSKYFIQDYRTSPVPLFIIISFIPRQLPIFNWAFDCVLRFMYYLLCFNYPGLSKLIRPFCTYKATISKDSIMILELFSRNAFATSSFFSYSFDRIHSIPLLHVTNLTIRSYLYIFL